MAMTTLVSLSGAASADAPPPEGTKFVGYSFQVENMTAFPDHVLIAYPWSTSNGAPTREHSILENGQSLRIGRRSDATKLYAMKRSAYDEWKQSYAAPENRWEDPALDALVASDKVVACDEAPFARFELAESDARTAITDVFRANRISDATCDLAVVSKPTTTPSGPSKGGCAGCAVTGEAQRSGILGVFALAALAWVRRRRAS